MSGKDVDSAVTIPQIRTPVPKWTDDLWSFRAIVMFIIFAAALGLGFVIPGLEDESLRVTLLVACPCCVILTLVLLLLLHWVDPGIVTPSPTKDKEILMAECGKIPMDLVIDSHGQWARRKLLLDGRSEITQRYCNTCNIWREPRTSHCSRCGYCMERFDHHCGAVGVCIARKNHRFFTLFLFFTSLASSLFLYACILRLQELDWSRYRVLMSTPQSVILQGDLSGPLATTIALLLLALMYFYTSLLIFFAFMHCTILLCDFTTKQYILKSREGRAVTWQRPSLKAWLHNMKSVCCTEIRSKFQEPTVPVTVVTVGDFGVPQNNSQGSQGVALQVPGRGRSKTRSPSREGRSPRMSA